MIVPAKNKSGTLTDSHAAVWSGNRELIVSCGRHSAAKIEESNRNPVARITRSYRISLITSLTRWKLTFTR